jgi:hypothetical protein
LQGREMSFANFAAGQFAALSRRHGFERLGEGRIERLGDAFLAYDSLPRKERLRLHDTALACINDLV